MGATPALSSRQFRFVLQSHRLATPKYVQYAKCSESTRSSTFSGRGPLDEIGITASLRGIPFICRAFPSPIAKSIKCAFFGPVRTFSPSTAR